MRRLDVWAGLTGVMVSIAFVWAIPGAQNDFVYDWLSASALVEGVDPYRPIGTLASEQGLVSNDALAEIHARFPGALLLLTPIGWIPYEYSYLAGRLLTVGSAFLLAWVASRILEIRIGYALAAVPVLLVVWPFSNVLTVSQSGYLIAALIGLTWLMDDKWLAGAPLGCAIALKVWPWLLVPALWLMGRRKTAVGAGAVFIALNLAGLMFTNVTLDGVERMLGDAVTFERTSVASMIGLPAWGGAALGLAALILVSRSTTQIYAWSIVLALIAAPIVWVHYVPALLIPLLLVIRERYSVSSREVLRPMHG